jgi:hypothetical protein
MARYSSRAMVVISWGSRLAPGAIIPQVPAVSVVYRWWCWRARISPDFEHARQSTALASRESEHTDSTSIKRCRAYQLDANECILM